MTLWKVTLYFRHKVSGEAWMTRYAICAEAEHLAVRQVVDSLDLGGVEMIDASASVWPATHPLQISSPKRAAGFDGGTS
jgi:hypothetical protein